MTKTNTATIGTNATLIERMIYEPHNVKHEELLATLEDQKEKLEDWAQLLEDWAQLQEHSITCANDVLAVIYQKDQVIEDLAAVLLAAREALSYAKATK